MFDASVSGSGKVSSRRFREASDLCSGIRICGNVSDQFILLVVSPETGVK